jgi:regulator of sigma E protease
VFPAVVGRVADGSPAATAGVRTGDRIVAANGTPIAHWADVERVVAESGGKPIELKVARGNATETIPVPPRQTTVRDQIFKETREVWDIGAGPQLIPYVRSVNPGSPAEKAGIKPGDQVVAVAGEAVYTPEEMTQTIQKRVGQPIPITVARGDRRETLTVTPMAEKSKDQVTGREIEVGRIGVGIDTKVVSFEAYGPVQAVWQGGVATWEMTRLTVKGFWSLVVGTIDRSNIGGPVQIASEAGRQAREGFAYLARFAAIISVNLAVLNLLPVPMLDGGHLAFFVVEGIIGRPISVKKREAAQQVGFVLLMLLMVYALYNDLVRIDAFSFFK